MSRYLTFIFLLPFLLCAQLKPIPINISLFNESTAIPFTRLITTPMHPGIQVGTEFNYTVKKHGRWYQSANIGYFYHRHLAQGVSLHSELGYEYRLSSGLAFTGLVGLGYMHTFATAQEFTFVNGQYEKKADRGNARLYPSLSIDIGYYLKKEVRNSPKLFVRYQSWAEYPYSPDFIPIMTHISLHAGVKFFIGTRSNPND